MIATGTEPYFEIFEQIEKDEAKQWFSSIDRAAIVRESPVPEDELPHSPHLNNILFKDVTPAPSKLWFEVEGGVTVTDGLI